MQDPAALAAALQEIVAGRSRDPFAVLGPHYEEDATSRGLVIRAFLPEAAEAWVVRGDARTAMRRVLPAGVFTAVFDDETRAFPYRLALRTRDGAERELDDPYRCGPSLPDDDVHLFAENTHHGLYHMLGAHIVSLAPAKRERKLRGVRFAVWAPNATNVSVIGSFNDWNPARHPMRPREGTGLWELFVPGLAAGVAYKFHLRSRYKDATGAKADPFAFHAEVRPETASIVYDIGKPRWRDDEWMATRAARQRPDQPMAIYEVHLGSWRRDADGGWLSYREIARRLVPYAVRHGFTHLELLPVSEHPFDGSWGYQTTGYFAPTSRFGTPDDFRFLVDTAHRAGLGVLLDWVPAHFPRDGHGLAFFDGTHLYEHADPRKGFHHDWNTFIYNYGRKEVCAFLLASALYWLDQYHIDGLRVDAVASMLYLNYSRRDGEWEPNEKGGNENLEAVAFLREFNRVVHHYFPGVLTFAEESTSWPKVTGALGDDGLGFDYKWNMGWMHDTLRFFRLAPEHRYAHMDLVTFGLMYAMSERYLLPFSHDEVVHLKHSLFDKMAGDETQQAASLRAVLGYLMTYPGKKLLFMGGEFGQRREWNHDAELQWDLTREPRHAGLDRWWRDLATLYRDEPALHALDHSYDGFAWCDFAATRGPVFSYRRRDGGGRDVVVVVNAGAEAVDGYLCPVAARGKYRVALNSDAPRYGGAGHARQRSITARKKRGAAGPVLQLDLAPLSVVLLVPADQSAAPAARNQASPPSV